MSSNPQQQQSGEAALLLYSVYASWLFLYAAADAMPPERR